MFEYRHRFIDAAGFGVAIQMDEPVTQVEHGQQRGIGKALFL